MPLDKLDPDQIVYTLPIRFWEQDEIIACRVVSAHPEHDPLVYHEGWQHNVYIPLQDLFATQDEALSAREGLRAQREEEAKIRREAFHVRLRSPAPDHFQEDPSRVMTLSEALIFRLRKKRAAADAIGYLREPFEGRTLIDGVDPVTGIPWGELGEDGLGRARYAVVVMKMAEGMSPGELFHQFKEPWEGGVSWRLYQRLRLEGRFDMQAFARYARHHDHERLLAELEDKHPS